MFESGRRRDSNMQPSNINKNNLVAPTGFVRWWDTSASKFPAPPSEAIAHHLVASCRDAAVPRDSLRGPRVNDCRSQATTTRAGQRGIPEFLAVINQARRNLPHLRKARRATEGQASRTERFSGSLLEDDSHCLRRIHQSISLGVGVRRREGVYAHRWSTEKRNRSPYVR